MVLRHRKLIKRLIILILLIIGGFEWLLFSISAWIKPEIYQQQVLDIIKKQTGKDLTIAGNARFVLLPTPRLVIQGLEMDNSNSDLFAPSLYSEKLEVHIEPMSLLSGEVSIAGVTLINPILSLERGGDNIIHWDWLNINLLNSLDNSDNKKTPPFYIRGGIISYRDNIHDQNIFIEDINLTANYNNYLYLSGSMKRNKRSYNFTIDNSPSDIKIDNGFYINFQMAGDNTGRINLKSAILSLGESPEIVGTINFTASDMWSWMHLPSRYKNNEKDKNQKKVAKRLFDMRFDASWKLKDGFINIDEFSLNGLNSKGGGKAKVYWNKWHPTIITDTRFEYIDYFVWKAVIEDSMAAKLRSAHPDDYVQNYDFNPTNPLPENIELKLNMKANNVLFGEQKWENVALNTVLDNGAVTINQCDINLKGDGLLSIFGVVSQGGLGNLRFEGNMEAKGKKFHESIEMFYPAANKLPDIGNGKFVIDSNLYMDSQQIRLFEADAVIDGQDMSGTMTAYIAGVPRVDMKIKLKDVNFDYIRDVLLTDNFTDDSIPETTSNLIEKKSSIIKKYSDNRFDWLKKIPTRMDIKVYIDDFTFMEKKGDKASFYLYAYKGDLRLSDIRFVYPDSTTELNFSLNVNNLLPYVNLMINADNLDTEYFIPSSAKIEHSKDKNSAKKLRSLKKRKILKEEINEYIDSRIPMEWMGEVDGILDINLRKLIHKGFTFENVKMRANLESRKLKITNLDFVYSQAETSMAGSVYGGKVPGILLNFTMSKADIYDILNPVIGLNNINGYSSLSGTISTTGWNFREWLEQMEGKFLISARGVKVKGINIFGVSNIIEVARSSADVFNNVNNVVTKGTTEFMVDGSINVRKGEIRAPGVTLRSGLVTGTIIGGIDLKSLSGQFSILFRFSNLSPDIIPIMVLQLSGKLNDPSIRVDTSSLEDFVAKRNVGRNIGN
ncbi:MAG: AsmA family protein [Rickettsiales bacterium]